MSDEKSAFGTGAAIATVSVRISSVAEPSGELVVLTQASASSPVFSGTIAFERLYEETGAVRAVASNGKIAVYAEGGVATDSVKVAYGDLSQAAAYAEPASTVTGRAFVANQPAGRAAIELLGAQGFDRKTGSRPDGSYAFHDVPSGSYTVIVAVNGAVQQSRTVLVP